MIPVPPASAGIAPIAFSNHHEGMNSVHTTVNVPVSGIAAFTKRMNKLNKIANKLGMSPLTWTRKGTAIMERATYVQYDVNGEMPQVAGWYFVGSIQHTESGNLLRLLPGVEIPIEFRATSNGCDHCRTNRARKDTYILRNGAGEYKQVGRACLKDFTGHATPEAIARWADCLAGGFQVEATAADRTYPLEYIINVTAHLMDAVSGGVYISKAHVDSKGGVATISALRELLFGTSPETQKMLAELEALPECPETAACIEHFQNIAVNDPDSYLWNLRVIADNEYVTYRELGLAASMLAAYRREQQAKNAPAAGSSRHQGVVGKPYSAHVKILRVKPFHSAYGTGYVVAMEDVPGNQFVWMSSRAVSKRPGEWVMVSGTVKKHDSYQGTPQTYLSRCKLA